MLKKHTPKSLVLPIVCSWGCDYFESLHCTVIRSVGHKLCCIVAFNFVFYECGVDDNGEHDSEEEYGAFSPGPTRTQSDSVVSVSGKS